MQYDAEGTASLQSCITSRMGVDVSSVVLVCQLFTSKITIAALQPKFSQRSQVQRSGAYAQHASGRPLVHAMFVLFAFPINLVSTGKAFRPFVTSV